MDTLELTQDNFHLTVSHNACLVIEFDTPRIAEDVLEQAKARHAGVVFAHVDSSAQPELAALFGLNGGPALLIFREQVVLYLKEGEHSAARIDELLRQLMALDMDAVRAHIEEQHRAELAVRMRRVCPTSRRGPAPRD